MVVGVGWGAKVASASVLLAISDPELITKTILPAISILSFRFGGYWVLRFSHYLMQGKYHFVLREEASPGEWEIEANPTVGIGQRLGHWFISDENRKTDERRRDLMEGARRLGKATQQVA